MRERARETREGEETKTARDERAIDACEQASERARAKARPSERERESLLARVRACH